MIRIRSMQVVTDRPLAEHRARSVGASFARALDAALQRDASDGPNVDIDHVRLELPGDVMYDRRAMRDAVQGVARRILERSGE